MRGMWVYLAALLVGVAAVLVVFPAGVLWGAGPGWHPPGPDQAQALTGHLAFQADAWRWPLLETRTLFWPQGISLALVDSNALFSLLAKAWTRSLGVAPENWLGAFLGLCWVLQPVAAAYAARELGVRTAGCVVAGVLSVAWPAFVFRMMHLNLCAHFEVLLALGLTFRGLRAVPGERRGARWWVAVAGLLLASVLTHPYLFQLCGAVLAAVPLQAAWRRRAGWVRDGLLYLGCGVLAVGVLKVISGPIGGGDKGFTFFSMNLVSPFWPQRSGVFGAALPIVDATGGQYEGLNWLGAGTMLLLVAGLGWAAARRAWPRPWAALVLVLLGLTMVSVSSVVYAGPVRLLNLGTKPWEDLFGSFRTSGRAFWPVGYALMLGAVALVDRMPRLWGSGLLAVAAVLQVVDIGPLRADATAGWTNGSGILVPAVPGGTTLFTVVPHPGCTREMTTKWGGPVMLLDAVRMGARTGDVGLGRSPNWFSCEGVVADGLELPLLPGESRAFFGSAVAALRPGLLGGAVCRKTAGVHVGAQAGEIVLCGPGGGPGGEDGAVVETGAAPAPLTLPATLEGAGLRGVLGFGWVVAGDGRAWSEGPVSTVLLPVVAGRAVTVRLLAQGVAFRAGEVRTVRVRAGRVVVGQLALPDGVATEVVVTAPGEATATGMLRLSLDVVRPVDPARRGLEGVVHRAAVVLRGIVVDVSSGGS